MSSLSERLSLALVIPLLVVGCHRAIRPELPGPRTIEAGLPLSFGSEADGAPEVTWDFGDGTRTRAAQATHTFERSGQYTVRALDGDRELAAVAIEVVPRAALRAIPGESTFAIVVPRWSGLAPLLAFVDRLTQGAAGARAEWIAAFVEEPTGPEGVIDPEEGLGLFQLEGFEAPVAFVGITDAQRAPDVVLEKLDAARTDDPGESDGLIAAVNEQGEQLFLFVDRGYLYAVLPDDDGLADADERGSRFDRPGVNGSGSLRAVAGELRARITTAPPEGLSGSPRWSGLLAKVAPGQAWMFTELSGADEDSKLFDAALVSVRVDGDRAELDGFMSATRALHDGAAVAVSQELFAQAPLGPVAVASFSLEPETLARLALGEPGSAKRTRRVEELAAEGLDVEAVFAALRGDVAAVAYVDAPAFFQAFIADRKPAPRGRVRVHVGLEDPAPVLAFARGLWRNEEVKETREDGATRLTIDFLGQPLSLIVGDEKAVVELGTELLDRPRGDLRASLQRTFGPTAVAEGHLTALVDLGQLRAEFAETREVPGVGPGQLAAAKALTLALLDQLTPLERAFLSVGPEAGGSRLKASISLRPE